MNLNTIDRNLVLAENDIALQYSEKPEELKTLLQSVKIHVEYAGKDFYFDGDKEKRLIIRVYVERGEKKINFRYGMSIHDTVLLCCEPENFGDPHVNYNGIPHYSKGRTARGFEYLFPLSSIPAKRKEVFSQLLYSILSCVASDYFIPDTFKDFCSEFGYNEDSRKAEKLFYVCKEQAEKLRTIFTEEEINCLPR